MAVWADGHTEEPLCDGPRARRCNGAGVDVADRLTDRPVAVATLYLAGSRPVSVTLFVARPSAHLAVFLPSARQLVAARTAERPSAGVSRDIRPGDGSLSSVPSVPLDHEIGILL